MKKLLSLIVCFFVAKTCFSQWPVVQNLGSDSTLVSIGRNFGGGIKGNLINTSYSDTTAANLQRIRQYAGGQIFTTGDTSLWLRSIGANKWVKLAGSAGATNIYNSNGSLTSDRVLSGTNLYNLRFDAVTSFRAEANASTGKISSMNISPDSVLFQPNEGIFIIDSLASGASTDSVLVWTQATGRVKKRAVTSIGTNPPISSLTAATGTNSIDNGNNPQEWQWNTLVGNNGLRLLSNATTAASNTQKLFYVSMSGINANSTQTTYAASIENLHTGTSSTNYGIAVAASNGTTNIAGSFISTGGTNNYAIIVPASSGDVGIGTSTPASKLHVVSTQTTGVGNQFSSSTTTSGSIMDITGTSTALAANNEGLNIAISGANGTNGITATGARISVTNTNGTSGTNVGLDVTASGATTANNAIRATGNVLVEGTGNYFYGRWRARVDSTTSSATPTINTDNVDVYKLTAQAADITSFTTNLSGTPQDMDILEITITGTAARAITWGTSFVSTTVTLPTTTVTTATLTVILQYYKSSSYGNNKWHCVNYY